MKHTNHVHETLAPKRRHNLKPNLASPGLPVPTCQSASAVFPPLCQTPSKSSTSRPFRQGKKGSMTHHRTSPDTADNRVHNVQWTLVLDRPERSGDLEPAGSRALCALKKNTKVSWPSLSFFVRITGSSTSSGRWFWTDRSGAETLNLQVPGRYAP